ncbi:hypothetical protein DFR29_11892 [Tahibacter aquaticus]|uniref:Uncharacterized protein n=1 Tax=Tahibacter aquaticus TaxID=520092 RepID=A0A4V3DLE6_9GAMM|nr:hypothetical protein [Tahibacter aquaticus]TDR38949.1 hypothetical protein DFR29_11892 [Tahibacter aquaticus]
MQANDDTPRSDSSNWREEGPQAIARGLQPDKEQAAMVDESLWLALNAWA